MEKESALLTLHSSFVSNAPSSVLTYKNIPIKHILGNMYNKYNKFKLVLNSNGCVGGSDVSNRQIFIRVSGLDFINTTEYYSFNKYQKGAIYLMPSTYYFSDILNQLPANHGAIFTKPSNPNIDIVISLLTNNQTEATHHMGKNMYVFSIYGVEE